jgi:hypothetical protein
VRPVLCEGYANSHRWEGTGYSALSIGFADKTDVLLLGPFLTGSHLLIERGGNDGCLLKFVGGITYAHPVPEVW